MQAVCSGLGIVTGIQGANNTLTIRNIRGTGKPQWVSFWYINQDDMGYGDQPGASPFPRPRLRTLSFVHG